jgi:hypothetical protein
MDVFDAVQYLNDDTSTMTILVECVRISMKQHCPELSNSTLDIEENFDIKTVYDILEYSAGVKINQDSEDEVSAQAKREDFDASWNNLDLASLEAEVFLLGIWKNFEELETSISIDELMKVLSTTRELGYEEKKFFAALQGVDLDGGKDENGNDRGQKEWENLKARVASGGAATDSSDILALQGTAARQAGFGIGLGLGYEDMRDPSVLKSK